MRGAGVRGGGSAAGGSAAEPGHTVPATLFVIGRVGHCESVMLGCRGATHTKVQRGAVTDGRHELHQRSHARGDLVKHTVAQEVSPPSLRRHSAHR